VTKNKRRVLPLSSGTQFFLRAEDEGKPRAEASVERIRALNPFACVEVEVGAVADKDADFFAGFDMVVLVNQPYADEVHANRCCRDNGARVAPRAFFSGSFCLRLCGNLSGSQLGASPMGTRACHPWGVHFCTELIFPPTWPALCFCSGRPFQVCGCPLVRVLRDSFR
jgi:hypothetical protein